MYTILGATGNIGSVITKDLLEKGEKVRVVGQKRRRDCRRLYKRARRRSSADVGTRKR